MTVEDNAISGGAGSAVNEFLILNEIQITVLNLGLPDRFLNHGSREQLLAEAGLDSQGILSSMNMLLNRRDCEKPGTQVIS